MQRPDPLDLALATPGQLRRSRDRVFRGAQGDDQLVGRCVGNATEIFAGGLANWTP
jgi:hypothetical protein